MSDQNFSEVDKLLSSDFDEPKKEETPKPVAEVPKTETVTAEEKQQEAPKTENMEVEEKKPEAVVEEVKTTPKRGRTPKKATTPKKVTPKKVTPTKVTPKKVEKEIVTDPLKVSTRKSTKHSDWSDLIYGSAEKFTEGDTLAVRAPKDSGDQFWLCALDGFGTEENNNKDDLEITWYEAKGTTGFYVEGEEDDIAADSVICRTRLNINKDGTWALPQVELKAIRDSLKLEKEESSEIILEGGDDKSDEASYKEGGEESTPTKGRPKREKEEKPKKEVKSGDKRKAAPETNGEPKPKRAYKKREKKVSPETNTSNDGMAVESKRTEAEAPTPTAPSTFPSGALTTTHAMPIHSHSQIQPNLVYPYTQLTPQHPMMSNPNVYPFMQAMPPQMQGQHLGAMPMYNHMNMQSYQQAAALQMQPNPSVPTQVATPTPTEIVTQQPPVTTEAKTEAV
jgi:hypothetical protein